MPSADEAALAMASNEKWDAFVRRHFERLCGYVRANGETADEAEDRVQNALISARDHDAIAQCDGDDKRVYCYLIKALQNGMSNEKRRLRRLRKRLARYARRPTAIFRPTQPDEYSVTLDIRRQLNRAIQELPKRCREAFIHTRIAGLSYAEAADVMGIDKKTIDGHLKRALRLLARSLANVDDDDIVNDRRERKEDTR
ncbi:MAG: RNA polymerase sigma factor [Gemmatimonadaceae bacterium]